MRKTDLVGIRKTVLSTIILLAVMTLTGCGRPLTLTGKQINTAAEKSLDDWQRISTTIQQFSYPQALLLFAPQKTSSRSELYAQNRHKINPYRYGKHWAIFKTNDPFEKVASYYSKRGMRPLPGNRHDQRTFACCEPQVKIILTAVENGTSITLEVPITTAEQPAMELAEDPTQHRNQ
ncbi:MAG: hypothetical protein AB1489_10920 [Acidobacteriota bacterium]